MSYSTEQARAELDEIRVRSRWIHAHARKLQAVADAARRFLSGDGGKWGEFIYGDYPDALADALDALDEVEPVAKLYVDGGEWGSERTDGRARGECE